MDIKRAKKEIKDSIEAYLAKDEYGDYMIPSIRQRPILLMGPPGIGKTQVMEQAVFYYFFNLSDCESVRHRLWNRWQRSVKSHWYLIRSHIIPDKVRSDFRLLKRRRTMGKSTRLQNIR